MNPPRIGIDLGGTKIEAILLSPDNVASERVHMPTPRDDYAATVSAITGIVERYDALVGTRCAVGIGTPGAWRADVGAMHNCNSTWLNDRPLLTDLTERLGARVRMANDANCLALSEAFDGAASDANCVFAAILGTGVGGGIVIDGELLIGRNAIAGEWGHSPMPLLRRDVDLPYSIARLERRLADRPCYCGRVNCVETFLSGVGLAQTNRLLWSEALDARSIAASPEEHHGLTMELYFHMLARSLAQILNLLDPDVIVVGGGVSRIVRLYDRVASLWHPYVFSDIVTTPIVPARHGAASGVRGAARLWGTHYTWVAS